MKHNEVMRLAVYNQNKATEVVLFGEIRWKLGFIHQ
jgi:hypothetical protein